MNISKKIKFIAIILFSIGLFSIGIISTTKETKLVSAKEVSNRTIAWGIKREKDHKQPDVGIQNKKVLDENNGICLGNNQEKIVYLTFDEGYEAGYTEKILAVLKQNNVKATFFITAHYLNSKPELVKKMIDEGHIVGNHTPKFLMSGSNINVKC